MSGFSRTSSRSHDDRQVEVGGARGGRRLSPGRAACAIERALGPRRAAHRSRRCTSRRTRRTAGSASSFSIRGTSRALISCRVRSGAALAADLFTAQQAVARAVKPDHVNVESLGNVVPHLHWHIIPRYVGDPMWGAPVWQVPLDSMPDTRLPDDERAALIAQLQKALAGPVTDMTGVGLTSRWVAARSRARNRARIAALSRSIRTRLSG